MPSRQEELIADILLGSPGHLKGTRPIHAPGIAATGWFRATDVAARYTCAGHFSGRRVPATVRFSDGTGLPVWSHSKPAVRGMAVKFHLGPEQETDMVAMTIGAFFCRTVDLFHDFCVAAIPVPVKRRPWWDKIRDMLTLRLAPREPAVGETTWSEPAIFRYGQDHPAACPAITALGAMVVPESYLACRYHPVHTFELRTLAGASTFVRFHWDPVEGLRTAGQTSVNFLQTDLRQRVKDGRAEFVLRAQVADAGDDLADVMRPWPERRRRLVMGHLVLDHVPDDQITGCERLRFDPTRLVKGIGPCPGDQILEERGLVYSISADARAAGKI